MSTGPRMPLAQADACVAWLVKKWPGCGVEPVGSVRRREADIGDIDLLAPRVIPQEPTLTNQAGVRDTLCDLIESARMEPGQGAATPERYTRPYMGLVPGFKKAGVFVRGRSGADIKIEIHRYDPGEMGNYGWKLIYTTGPGMGGGGRWPAPHGIPPHAPAAIDGYLLEPTTDNPRDWPAPLPREDKAGRDRMHRDITAWPVRRSPRQSSEAQVFAAIGERFVEPAERARWLESKARGGRKIHTEMMR